MLKVWYHLLSDTHIHCCDSTKDDYQVIKNGKSGIDVGKVILNCVLIDTKLTDFLFLK
jgi:hypothetical protein